MPSCPLSVSAGLPCLPACLLARSSYFVTGGTWVRVSVCCHSITVPQQVGAACCLWASPTSIPRPSPSPSPSSRPPSRIAPLSLAHRRQFWLISHLNASAASPHAQKYPCYPIRCTIPWPRTSRGPLYRRNCHLQWVTLINKNNSRTTRNKSRPCPLVRITWGTRWAIDACVAFAPHRAAPVHAPSNSPHLPQFIQDIVGVETPNVPSLEPLAAPPCCPSWAPRTILTRQCPTHPAPTYLSAH